MRKPFISAYESPTPNLGLYQRISWNSLHFYILLHVRTASKLCLFTTVRVFVSARLVYKVAHTLQEDVKFDISGIYLNVRGVRLIL